MSPMHYARSCLGMFVFCVALLAQAAVSEEEAKQLGTTLTPWGAEKAGNKDGSIPEYKDERITPPSTYDPKEPGHLPDPWNDKPLYSITAQNAAQYEAHLSEGHLEMFKKYPNFRMDVYPSRRTARYPKYVIDNTLKNATSCTATKNELRLEGCYGGIPFPIPKTGNQVVWNHAVYFGNAHAVEGQGRAYLVANDGKVIMTGDQAFWGDSPFYDQDRTGPAAPNSLYSRVRIDYTGPARKNGEKYLVREGLDPVDPGHRVWQYLPGQRRVKLAPDLAFDTPSPTSGGVSTIDENLVFIGSQERYDMKLLGKKEVYLQYNNFRITDPNACPVEKYFTKNFANPECVRWELHRVFVVEGRIKPEFRHVLPRRMMYFDEDVWGAGTGVGYDASGRIFRVEEAPYFPYYNLGYGHAVSAGITLDLNTGAYYQTTYYAYPGGGIREGKKQPDTFYSPDALAGEGIR